MKSKHPRRHNAIEMNVDGQPNRRYTKTDEVSVIARGRACVRTVQYRHSEVMRSFGRSHIQRCVRAAAAQAMYDPCYYVPPMSNLALADTALAREPRPAWLVRCKRNGTSERSLCRRSGKIEMRELAAVGRHKGSRTPTPRTNKPCWGVRAGAGTNEQSLTEVLTVRRPGRRAR
ncbi:unnamed protein product [Chrysodeixis includens]|uniref:Uncharacterized protein n=1 Tax=Chrysodeixis includens TaxID=689277 RepID=A0A9N8L2K0_CHRIL|nr:unnamed protein product [Chrysodeixis includens]